MVASEAPESLDAFTITPAPPAKPELFVDHEKTGRSGHIGHALFQRPDGEIFAFFPNCASDDPGRHGTTGHSATGWMEVKRSRDGGRSWSEPVPLDYSKRTFDAKLGHTIFTEKAVVTDNGTIVLFHLLCDVSKDALWEPYLVPTSTRSTDGGETWSEPIELCPDRGRIYSAIHADGLVCALKFRNDAEENFCGSTDEHIYSLYASRDDGASFHRISDLPFDTRGRGYGTLCRLNDGRLIAYVYNRNDEEHLDYAISNNGGISWSPPRRSVFAKRIRNPQMIGFGGGYFMHGRSGTYGPEPGKGHFVMYYSRDGVTWDDGIYLAKREHGQGAYSNSLVVRSSEGHVDGKGPLRLRIHASHAYSADSTNIVAWWVDEAARG
ncbi:sialidase family protein [Azospirillum himalayense]|uniref:Sialidase family protein n=1 Tax=Azospirillum himalayense TaxID=654847 RepID=A0ABW0G9I4_9PROT